MSPADIRKYLKNPGLLNESTLEATRKMTEVYPASSMGWALWLRNLRNTSSPLYTESLNQVALRVPNRKWLKEFLEIPEVSGFALHGEEYLAIDDYDLGDSSIENEPGNSGQQSKMELIDKFLSGGGTFGKQLPTSGYMPSNLADKAVEETDDIVTETFANLLLSQGNLDKAIQAFEKLILKYPEKSIYFAARIEEIKKLKNH